MAQQSEKLVKKGIFKRIAYSRAARALFGRIIQKRSEWIWSRRNLFYMEREHLSLRKHPSFMKREALGERKGESNSLSG